MTTYTVRAEPWEHGWELHIDGHGVTQVRELADAEQRVRDYLETLTGVDTKGHEVIVRAVYLVRGHRDGGWWAIEVAGVEGAFSQARHVDQIEEMARDLVAGLLEVDPDSFDLAVELQG